MNISVIIPVYGVEAYIERCINSIMNQTFTEGVECIIVDDCTPDHSIKIAEKLISEYKGNISFQIVHHTQNQGLAIARDTGILKASGKYIIHIDSDDYCEPNMLECMFQKAENENADIVIADFFKTYKTKEYYIAHKPLNKKECLRLLLEAKLSPAVWNKLVKKEIIDINHIQNIKGGDSGEDYYTTIRICFYAKKIVFINQAFVHYVQYNANSYTYAKGEKRTQSHILITEAVKNFLIKNKIFEIYKESFFIGAANLKSFLLANSKGERQRYLNSLYPESRKIRIIMKTKQKLPTKIALVFAAHNILFVFNIYNFLLQHIRRLMTKYKNHTII